METEGVRVGQALVIIAERLVGTPDEASVKSLERSYGEVERAFKSGEGARFYVFQNTPHNVL